MFLLSQVVELLRRLSRLVEMAGDIFENFEVFETSTVETSAGVFNSKKPFYSNFHVAQNCSKLLKTTLQHFFR